MKANRTSSLPQALHPVPPQIVTQVLLGSLPLRTVARNALQALSDFSFNSLPPSRILFQHLRNFRRRQFPVIILINKKHGRKRAGSQAGYGFKGELGVRCGFIFFDAKKLLNGLANILSTSDMTGGPPTDSHGVASPGTQVKLCIKSDYTVNATHWDTQAF